MLHFCMAGVLLRPSWPATAVDASFLHASAFLNLAPIHLWTAQSMVASGHLYSYILSINLRKPLTLPVVEFCGGGEAVAELVVVYEAWHGLEHGVYFRKRAKDTFTVPATPERSTYVAGHSLWVVAPVLTGNWTRAS